MRKLGIYCARKLMAWMKEGLLLDLQFWTLHMWLDKPHGISQ